MNSTLFQQSVAAQFKRMSAWPLFRVNATKDEMWDTYLNSFPEGTNPLYRKRTEHDCSCCRHFIRDMGNVVAISPDGHLETIWDGNVTEPAYQAVARAMEMLIRQRSITDTFLHDSPTAGTAKNFEETVDGAKTWTHFFVNVPSQYITKRSDIPTKLNATRTAHGVFKRGLEELTVDALDTVLDLIAQNSLYRGEEHKFAVNAFRTAKLAYDASPRKELFTWAIAGTQPGSVTGFRNTSIGQLVIALSEGKELEDAVKAFEAMVAPTNYKRPTALVTKAMIEAAKTKVEELGLTSALERRYATLADITINNVLFADRAARKEMGVFDMLTPTKAASAQAFDKVEEVPIEKFLLSILPNATALEIMVDNGHTGNFMSLVAPADPTARSLFKWANNFSWSYNGDVADSMKKRVKAAGGNVTGDLCCRLSWEYRDDLDFHMHEPHGGHIYCGTRHSRSPCGGKLDVDANGASGMMDHPVENIFYADRKTMADGFYRLRVNNYFRRDTDNKGFEVEIEFDGKIHHMVYDKAVGQGATVDVAEIAYSKKNGFEIISSLPATSASKVVWGVPTMAFSKVSAIMLSPNHWDAQGVGNRHYFFMLDGCRNEGKARGFYNEFLKSDLDAHRKVIEMVGAKMKTETSEQQLSGLGFSSTQRNAVLCRVTGSFSRVIKIVF